MKKLFVVLFFFVISSFKFITAGDVTLTEINDYNSWGKKALVIDNGIIQLVIIPEIGGRILYYGFPDDEYMAVNQDEITETYDPSLGGYGPWSSWGYGGYKAWPAPQSVWPNTWPPPAYLDWGSYSYSIEHSSADSVIIYMKSSVELFQTPGLQQSRRIKVYKNSTHVVVEQVLINESSTETDWAVWEVTQAIVDHGGTHDYENISVYFPSDSVSIKNLMGSGVSTTRVDENVRKFNYNHSGNKIGTLLNEGWACFVDESDTQTYAKVFEVDPLASYTDQNSNFQIYVGGTYVEIEVLGPITEIFQGDSVVYVEHWYASHTKGNIYSTNHAGTILSRLNYNETDNVLTGEYGVFSSGKLKLIFSDNYTEIGRIDTFQVTAGQYFNLDLNDAVPSGTTNIELQAFDLQNQLIGKLDKYGDGVSGLIPFETISKLNVFPTFANPGGQLYIQVPETMRGEALLELFSINGQVIDQIITMADQLIQYQVPAITSGVYILRLRNENYTGYSKVVIR